MPHPSDSSSGLVDRPSAPTQMDLLSVVPVAGGDTLQSLTPLPAIPRTYQRPSERLEFVSNPNTRLTKSIAKLLDHSGMSIRQISEIMGISPPTLKQYRYGRRNPSVEWFARLVTACGAQLIIEFPRAEDSPGRKPVNRAW